MNGTRQRDRWRRAEKAEINAVDAEFGGFDGIGKIAGGDKLAAGGDGSTLNASDERLW
jgi:nanoRNase/pAp phosphatase (c-di-AMP/oligoRNAs hydrolase)